MVGLDGTGGLVRRAMGTSDRSLYRALGDTLAGFAVFLIAQIALIAWMPDSVPSPESAGWFLNSGANVAGIGLALAGAAALISLRRSGALLGAVWFAAGATTAMGGVLLAIGPGNLLPIVLVIGTLAVATAVGAGTALGLAVRSAAHLAIGLHKRDGDLT